MAFGFALLGLALAEVCQLKSLSKRALHKKMVKNLLNRAQVSTSPDDINIETEGETSEKKKEKVFIKQ